MDPLPCELQSQIKAQGLLYIRLVPAKLSQSEPHLWLATTEKVHAPTTTLIYEGVLSTLLTPSVVVQIA